MRGRIAAASILVASVVGGVVVHVHGQSEDEPCKAIRTGDIVTVDLSTCQEVTSSTTTPPPTPPSSSTSTTDVAGTVASTTAPTTVDTVTPASSSVPDISTTAPPTVATTSEPTTTDAPTTTSSVTSTVRPTTSTTAPSSGNAQFLETFETAAALERFEYQIHEPVISTRIDTWHGDHDMACHPPDVPGVDPDQSTRLIHHGLVSETVYWCAPGGDPANGHMMTSMSSAEYAHLDFSPKQSFTDVSKVCWSSSLYDMGQRKWMNVVVVPTADVAAHGGELRYVAPDFDVAGTPFWNGVRLPPTGFMMSGLEGSQTTYVGDHAPVGQNLDGFRTLDKRERFQTCMTDLGNGIIRFLLHRRFPDGTPWTLTRDLPGRFPDGHVRVIFQDITYDNQPGHVQSGRTNGGLVVGEYDNTWHWDDIAVY